MNKARTKEYLALIGSILGIMSTLLAIVAQLGAFGDFRLPLLPGKRVEATLSLSTGDGPSGTKVTVTGKGFEDGETVQIRFNTEDIGTARTDDEGSFSTEVTIPGSFDAFAPQQFHIVASGRSSIRSATVPFKLLAGGTATAGISLSKGSGPSGTVITVSGEGFQGGERVQIRYHADLIGTAITGKDGTFTATVTIPGSFDAFAPQQYEITAVGASSLRAAEAPFLVTK